MATRACTTLRLGASQIFFIKEGREGAGVFVLSFVNGQFFSGAEPYPSLARYLHLIKKISTKEDSEVF